MPYITLLGQYSSHGTNVVNSNQFTITILNKTINVENGAVAGHSYHHDDHDSIGEISLINNMQSYVTINGMPIFLIGDSSGCGSILCPDPNSKKPQQEFIQIS